MESVSVEHFPEELSNKRNTRNGKESFNLDKLIFLARNGGDVDEGRKGR